MMIAPINPIRAHRSGIACAIAVATSILLSGCASGPKKDAQYPSAVSEQKAAITPVDYGIDVAQRALPSLTNSVRQPAHYQHVYVEGMSEAAESVKTLPLADAVANNVLASSDKRVRKFELDADRLQWAVLDRSGNRPSSIEGVGGAGVDSENLSEVNFDLNETVIINPERLDKLIKKARLVSGAFYIVGYADESGIEVKNYYLSQDRSISVATYLANHGIHASRIKNYGAGISRIYSGLDRNRRASVSFLIEE